MPDPNPHDMLTRIEILERRVDKLERDAMIARAQIGTVMRHAEGRTKKVLCYWLPGCPDPHRCLEAGKCLGDVG
jgi:hypothetical protein